MLSVVKLMRWLDSCQRVGACNLERDAEDQTAHDTSGGRYPTARKEKIARVRMEGNGSKACPGHIFFVVVMVAIVEGRGEDMQD